MKPQSEQKTPLHFIFLFLKMKLMDYFERPRLLRVLARWRVRIAEKRHADDLLWRIGEDAPNPSDRHDADKSDVARSVCACLPSRKKWGRSTRTVRPALSHGKMMEDGIVYAVSRQSQTELEKCDWGRNLKRLLEDVSNRLQRGTFEFSAPELAFIPKGHDEVRCLAKYTNLSDRLILSQTAKYIRDSFDPLLMPCSYAFRRSGEISHITAIRKLREYRQLHAGCDLYVAECDIQKFFDVINHAEILAAYDSFSERLGGAVDLIARNVLMAYLNSYCSFRNAEESALDDKVRKKIGFLNSKDLRTALWKFYGKAADFVSLPIGIPQGGALSPILVNLVLDCADHAVLDGAPDDLFYARFCDDMVIVHPDKKVCKAAYDRFMAKMDALRLPIHKARSRFSYGAAFYGERASRQNVGKPMKSKGPYRWTDAKVGDANASPWVSFLGQQVRFDGEVRIRNSSVDKQCEKLRQELTRFVRACGKNGQKLRKKECVDEAYQAFSLRLMAIGVGYSKDSDRGSVEDKCWMAAFPGVTANSFSCAQMRKLDHARDAVLSKVRHGPLANADGQPAKSSVRFLGYPFSYLGYLERVSRPPRWLLSGNDYAYDEW